jgi:hypothetical protein
VLADLDSASPVVGEIRVIMIQASLAHSMPRSVSWGLSANSVTMRSGAAPSNVAAIRASLRKAKPIPGNALRLKRRTAAFAIHKVSLVSQRGHVNTWSLP